MAANPIEALIRRALAGSPRARELTRELDGQALAVEVTGVTRRILRVESESIALLPDDPPIPVVATLRGGPLSLLALAGPEPEAVLRRGAVQITGDAEAAQRFQSLLQLLRPDLEEELSRLIGDAPAHGLSRAARAFLGWGRNAARTAASNVSEFLSHERGDLVPRAEGEALFRDIEGLRESVDRLAARLDLLSSRIPFAAASDPESASRPAQASGQ